MEIGFIVSNKRTAMSSDAYIVCRNSDYTAAFTFDSEWDDVENKRLALSYYKDDKITTEFVNLDANNKCSIPVMSDVVYVFIGATSDTISSSPVRIKCLKSAMDFHGSEYVPHNDVYNELMERVNQILSGR